MNEASFQKTAATFQKSNQTGISWVLRDSQGSFKGAATRVLGECFELKVAEAQAVKFALQWLQQHQVHEVDIESDAE